MWEVKLFYPRDALQSTGITQVPKGWEPFGVYGTNLYIRRKRRWWHKKEK